jgi:deazaflavin-dependent oxidoreductase (nitroreductase family)
VVSVWQMTGMDMGWRPGPARSRSSPLVVYHFMFGPDYEAGCPACSATADSFNGVPVAYHPQPGGRFAIWAANGGSPTHPNWYYNLKAHPRITAEAGAQAFTVLAQELDDTARAGLWPKLVSAYPQLAEAQARTTRQFPLFMLTRQD